MPHVNQSSWFLRAAVLAALAALASLSAGTIACKSGDKQEANTFRIGVITSLDRRQAAFGQAHKNGYTIAVNESTPRAASRQTVELV